MINIAELLKDAQKGMKLYSPLFGEVEYMQLGDENKVWVKTSCGSYYFDKYGKPYAFDEAECLLFPSKEVRTWEGWKLPVEPKFKIGTWLWRKTKGVLPLMVEDYDEKEGYLMQFTDETKCYFGRDIIENDYRLWEISDAKEGDVLAVDWNEKNGHVKNKWEKIVIFKSINIVGVEGYGCTFRNNKLAFDTDVPYYSTTWTHTLKPAIKKQRDLLFAKMRKAGYEWDEKKKELKKIPKHYDISNFKPKQWVLVRDCDNQVWGLSMFSHRDMGCYICLNRVDFRQCIPLEGNEKLLGTTNPCDKRYINW